MRPALDEPRELLESLVAIDSVNPSLVSGAPGEAAAAALVAERLRAGGFAVEVIAPAPGRPSVVATAAGSGGGRTLMLNGHLDTVALGAMPHPLEPRVEGGRLHGRGALDMKAGVAAMIVAAERAVRDPHRGDVVVACVCDEEHASLGSYDVARRMRADGAIVTEPTRERLVVAHKGFVWASVETRGVAAHGSRADLGVDAIARMGPVLAGIGELADRLAAGGGHPLLGPGSVHASLIEGGQELSTYPARCRVELERRTVPGEDAKVLEAELRAIAGDAEVELGLEREPFEVAPDAEIVATLRACAREVLGGDVELAGAAYWTDAAALAAAGIPTVLFGPSGEGEHADDEWVELASLERCAAVLEQTIRRFCA